MRKTLAIVATASAIILTPTVAAAAPLAVGTVSAQTATTTTDTDNGDKTGLWGLLGLIGLAGLIKRRVNDGDRH